MGTARTSRRGNKATSKRESSSRAEKKEKQKKGKSKGFLASTCIPIAVIAVAYAVGKWGFNSVDPQVSEILRLACSHEDVFCSPSLVPTRRTVKTTRHIQAGEALFKIPRRLQVWDLDAAKDPFIREKLLSARIGNDRTPLDSKSFLAVYVARLLKHKPKDLDPVLAIWLEILVTNYVYENHPIFWSKKELEEDLGSNTLAYDFVMNMRQKGIDEYTAFMLETNEFAKDISLEEYLAVRVTVFSRTFSSKSVLGDEPRAEQSEIAFFRKKTGIDLNRGGAVLIPVIDIFDHHRKASLKVKAESQQEVVVRATGYGIPAGSEVFYGYGSNPENYLFALYGFTTGDGSHPTYASLELWHKASRGRHIDLSELRSQHQTQVYKYLQYDDGYANCVDSEQDEAWSLKIAKYQFLVQIAHQEWRWCVYGNPRNPDSTPPMASNLPATLEVPTFQSRDDSMIVEDYFYATCRLLSLTEHDYDGTALKVLQDNMENDSYVFQASGKQDALEYRTLHCVKRMATAALERYGVTVQEQVSLVARLNREDFQSRAWIIAHVRLGEMQTLEVLKDRAVAKLQTFGSVPDSDPLYFIREKPCSLDFVEPLAELSL